MKRCFLSLICGVLITALFFIIPQSALAASDPYEYFYRQLFSGSLDDMLSYDDSDLDWPYSIYEIVRDNDLWYDPLPSEAEFSEYIDLMERKNGISMEQWHEMLMDFQWMYDIYSVPLYSDLKSRILPDEEQVYQYTHLLSSGLTISNGELMEIDSSQYYTETSSTSFEDGSGLNVLVLDDDNIIDIGSRVFTESYGEFYHLILPNSVDEISVGAFMDAPFISISMPSVTWLDSGAFQRCNLVQFEVPRGVTYLPDGVFRQCDNLSYIIIPPEVTDISPDFIQYSSGDLYNAKGVMPIIYGWKNTAAEQYALSLGLPFVPVGVEMDVSKPVMPDDPVVTEAPIADEVLLASLEVSVSQEDYLCDSEADGSFDIPFALTVSAPNDNDWTVENIGIVLDSAIDQFDVLELPDGVSVSSNEDGLLQVHIDSLTPGRAVRIGAQITVDGWPTQTYDSDEAFVTIHHDFSAHVRSDSISFEQELTVDSLRPFAARKLYVEQPDVYRLFEDKIGSTQDNWQIYRAYLAWYYLRADSGMQAALLATIDKTYFDRLFYDRPMTLPVINLLNYDINYRASRMVENYSSDVACKVAIYTLFHECGHSFSNTNWFASNRFEMNFEEMEAFVENYIVDYLYGKGYNDEMIFDIVPLIIVYDYPADFEAFQEANEELFEIQHELPSGSFEEMLQEIGKQFKLDYDDPLVYCTLSDVVMGGLTNRKIRGVPSHSEDYYQKDNRINRNDSSADKTTFRSEFWADYFAMTFMKNEEWDSFMRETLPNCMAAADSLMEELLADYQ